MAARRKNLGSNGELAFRNAFRQIDTNRNGYLNYEETVNAYNLISHLLR